MNILYFFARNEEDEGMKDRKERERKKRKEKEVQ